MSVLGTRVACGGVLALAVVLLASGALKLVDPFPAVHALVWTGTGRATRMAMVVGLSVVEAVVGSALVVGLWSRPILWLSAALAIALAAGHATTSILGDGSECGCFGAVAVPTVVVYALLGLGAVTCLLRARWPRAIGESWPTARWRAGMAGALVVATTHPAWVGESLAAEAATPTQVLATLGIADPGPDQIVMIGSWACAHCRRAIDAIDELREAELRDDLVLHLVQRRSDRAAAPGVAKTWIREHRIADRTWWGTIIGQAADLPPPARHADRGDRRLALRLATDSVLGKARPGATCGCAATPA